MGERYAKRQTEQCTEISPNFYSFGIRIWAFSPKLFFFPPARPSSCFDSVLTQSTHSALTQRHRYPSRCSVALDFLFPPWRRASTMTLETKEKLLFSPEKKEAISVSLYLSDALRILTSRVEWLLVNVCISTCSSSICPYTYICVYTQTYVYTHRHIYRERHAIREWTLLCMKTKQLSSRERIVAKPTLRLLRSDGPKEKTTSEGRLRDFWWEKWTPRPDIGGDIQT